METRIKRKPTGAAAMGAGPGRPKGVPNKMTATIRENFERVFHMLQDDKNPARLEAWARANPTEFYKLAAKLIPVDVAHQGNITLSVITGVPRLEDDQ